MTDPDLELPQGTLDLVALEAAWLGPNHRRGAAPRIVRCKERVRTARPRAR